MSPDIESTPASGSEQNENTPRKPARSHSLGPLTDDSVVAIVGGGPSGAGCAIALLKMADEKGIKPKVFIYEGKTFEKSTHYNQCVGVLSPPIEEIMKDNLGVDFPHEMTQRLIEGYILHGAKDSILLEDKSAVSVSVRRVNFDAFLLAEAEKRGAKVIRSRVTSIELHHDCVRIYAESGNMKVDVIVGAFGLDDGACKIFERDTSYKMPPFLDSIVTKIHPGTDYMNDFENYIHAFLPPIDEIEFGAITPKYNHLTINIAGSHINTNHMDSFLKMKEVREVLPPAFLWDTEELNYYKGRFPIGIAKGFYGDRFVTIGDAAGMVRPFKGKGVNSGILTGYRAAKVMIEYGISKTAFKKYHQMCEGIVNDLIYGKALRFLTIRTAKMKLIDPVLELAGKNKDVNKVLFDCVSAHESLKNIFRFAVKKKVFLKMMLKMMKKIFR